MNENIICYNSDCQKKALVFLKNNLSLNYYALCKDHFNFLFDDESFISEKEYIKYKKTLMLK